MDKLKIENNISLRQYTSMYVGGLADYFFRLQDPKDLPDILSFSSKNNLPVFVLGGGSNVIISDSGFKGLVIKNEILGLEETIDNEIFLEYKVGAGENWDKFVEFCVSKNLYGLENLSHIPGTVGASVVQNIGAYGAEVSSSVVSIDVYDIIDSNFLNLKKEELNFSYRKSRLNDPTQDKGRYIVTYVYFRLNKKGELNTKYDDIKKYFAERQDLLINLKSLRQAVIEVRDKKFPYPDKPEHGTVGSFWNAEVVNKETYEKIILKLDEMGFKNKADEMRNKISAFIVAQGYKVVPGLFIEILGYKGKKVGNIKILETHAGIINNYSGIASAKEVMDLSNEVSRKVFDEFGVKLKVEPELVGDFN